MSRIYAVLNMSFARIYQMYIEKIERKGRTKDELNTVIFWLTGHDDSSLGEILLCEASVEEFFETVPQLNENACLITGTICGYKVEQIKDSLEKRIRMLDKLVDELAKGKPMERILRK